MKTSESVINISKAMIEAQKKIKHAIKDAKNPHFKNDYATLESVIDASKSALLEQGVLVVQSTDNKCVTTRLQHLSGEFFESSIDLMLDKNTMQGFGSALTYGRRYSLAAMLNIAQADDDGNEASNVTGQQIKQNEDKATEILNMSSLGDYVIKFGAKMKGKKLKDFQSRDHRSMIDWLKSESNKSNKPINGPALEYMELAEKYIIESEEFPF